ncbi:AMP-binding protein [Streptomyces sp. NPDC048636]|uniref:class I adenylate-forming enzyme family protein n=1 Tax=Streptomyces sp. NPDC048636 TaxID=3155762 RepID=UPI00341B50FD
MHLARLPDNRAALAAQQTCMEDETTLLTNEGFLHGVRSVSALLRHRGIRSGDVLALMLPNRVEFVIALFAAWRLGAAVTPINPALTMNEVAHQLTDARAKAVIAPAPLENTPTICLDELTNALDTHLTSDPVSEDPDSTALIIYTSGSTGRPKGVVLDHTNLLAMSRMLIEAGQLGEDDHSLLVLPLFHVNGIVIGVLSCLLAGGRVTIGGRFKAERFFRLVEEVRPTLFSAVPAIFALLAALPESMHPDTSSIRFALCGAAPMPPQLIQRFEERYGVVVIEGYGLSEGTCVSTVNPVHGVRKPGTVGLPLPGQEVGVVDGTGRPLPPGEVGEVVVRGANVMRGYLSRPEETARTVVDGWLHTGDVGRLDEDGYLTLIDRRKDMIIRGGENIYPKEIESVLYAHDDIYEAAVVGAPHDVLGEVPVAYVTLRENSAVPPDGLIDHCRGALAPFKLPVAVITLDQLPKNSVGKIDKPALRERLAADASSTGLKVPVSHSREPR